MAIVPGFNRQAARILALMLAGVVLAVLNGCARDSNDKRYPQRLYKAYAVQQLRDIRLVDMAGAQRTRPRFKQDYHQLPDFAAIHDVSERKQAFFDYLEPAVDYQNAINRERRLLLGAIEIKVNHDLPLSMPERVFMRSMRAHFRIPEDATEAEALATLERRIGSIPASMVLAQAALESGWGTSRFAREANNLFGQWCFSEGCGVVPNRRAAGATHEVARFETVDEAVGAYFHNINTHPFHAPARNIRQQARAEERSPTGLEMVDGLNRYSALGEEYIGELRQVIRHNGLE